MNIFQNAETFYGGESKEVAEVPLLSIFRLAKQIRLQLGPKGYLLDSYLDIVFQGLMSGSVSDVLEDGLNAAFDLQPSLLRHIVEGAKPDMPHPLYHQAQEVYEQYPSVKSFQEHRTRMYLLMALLGDKPLVSALSEFAAEQHSRLLRRVPKVEVPGFFAGGGGLQGEKCKESLVDSEHFRRSQAPFPCRKRRVRRL